MAWCDCGLLKGAISYSSRVGERFKAFCGSTTPGRKNFPTNKSSNRKAFFMNASRPDRCRMVVKNVLKDVWSSVDGAINGARATWKERRLWAGDTDGKISRTRTTPHRKTSVKSRSLEGRSAFVVSSSTLHHRPLLKTHHSKLTAHCVKLQSSSCAQESAPGP